MHSDKLQEIPKLNKEEADKRLMVILDRIRK